jgi:hypothetical protein
MKNLVTILTFTFAHETGLVRSYLESEGIETFMVNDYSAQTISLYSNATGGFQIQVDENDYEKAYLLLVEKGFIKKAPPLKIPSWLKPFEKFTSKVPILKNYSPEFRLFFILAILVTTSIIAYIVQSQH